MAKKTKYNDMSGAAAKLSAAPVLPYQPPKPSRYNPPIAMIGCGGITKLQLAAYQRMGLNIVALCDVDMARAKARRKEFFPEAELYSDYKQLLRRDDIEVVDIATHPQDREYLIPAALKARKHVLSQKPFVLNLDLGHKFIDLADTMNVKLAVNQNGRWSPHWSWTRHAIQKGLIGNVDSIHLSCHWNHEWIIGTPFNSLHHIILYDFAIHWFDAIASFMAGYTPKKVFSTLQHASQQKAVPPLIAQSLIEFDHGQASLIFDGATRHAGSDDGAIFGSKGTLRYSGPTLSEHTVELSNKSGQTKPDLSGTWFSEGFMGSMGALLLSIERNQIPPNNPLDNLRGLAICFAAVVSAETGKPELVGKIRKAPLKTCMVKSD